MYKKILGFAMLALASNIVTAAPTNTVSTEYKECEQFSQADLNQCTVNNYLLSENRLKEVETNLTNKIKVWTEDNKYRSIASRKLTESRRDFVDYKKSNCSFAAALGGGAVGAAINLREVKCQLEMNKNRINEFNAHIEGIN